MPDHHLGALLGAFQNNLQRATLPAIQWIEDGDRYGELANLWARVHKPTTMLKIALVELLIFMI